MAASRAEAVANGGDPDGSRALTAVADAPGGTTIAELRPGRRFGGRYACRRKDRLVARNGGTYLSLELRDRTGSLPARVFREADRIALRFAAGDAIEVRGRLERYRGELVADLDDVNRLEPGSFDPAEFLPAAYRSLEELEGFLEHLAREIADPALRGLVERTVLAEPLAGEFRRAPCTSAGHHAYLGGLLEHTVSVAMLVGELCQLHPRLDSDLLMAAAILHDVGKTREFTYGAEFGLTDEGRLIGHLALGAEIVGRAAADAGVEHQRRLVLLHCVLAHHGPDAGPGRARHGAAQGPRRAGSGFGSPEALALYRLNSLDAGVKRALEQGL
jgi:3'-5' exoribonuclease